MKEKENIILYFQQYESVKHLSLEDKGLLFDAIFTYAIKEEIVRDLPPLVDMAFAFIRTSIDIDSAKYKQKCDRNRETANMRWNSNVSERIQLNAGVADTNKQNRKQKKDTTSTEKERGVVDIPPNDKVERNLSALNRRLSQLYASPAEMQEIYRLTNYGQIGNPIWAIFSSMDRNCEDIKMPIRYILSKLQS